jgi:hypothetical protein
MKEINKILAKIESYVWGKNCDPVITLASKRAFRVLLLELGGVVWGWLYFINSLQKKHRQPPSCIVKFLKILCIIIIKQIQNMNLMLNMKEINKILAKIESYVWGKNCNIWSSLIPPSPFFYKMFVSFPPISYVPMIVVFKT